MNDLLARLHDAIEEADKAATELAESAGAFGDHALASRVLDAQAYLHYAVLALPDPPARSAVTPIATTEPGVEAVP